MCHVHDTNTSSANTRTTGILLFSLGRIEQTKYVSAREYPCRKVRFS